MKNVIRSTRKTSSKAGRALISKRTSRTTKSLAGSVLSNRRRKGWLGKHFIFIL